MATNFPGAIDDSTSLPYPSASDDRNSPSLAGLNDNQNDAVIAVETKLGYGSASQTPAAGYLLRSATNGESTWDLAYPTSGTFVGLSDTQTLTNKTIDASSNTISNLSGSDLASNTITATQIANGTITATQIANGTITNTQIASGALYTSKIYNPYKFSVYRGTSTQTVSSLTWTKVQLNTSTFDTGSNFDHTTNYQFTAPIAGFYYFYGQVYMSGLSNGNIATIGINKGSFSTNPTYQGNRIYAVGSVDLTPTISAVIQLAANDTVQLYGYTGQTSFANGTATAQATYFMGYLISAT